MTNRINDSLHVCRWLEAKVRHVVIQASPVWRLIVQPSPCVHRSPFRAFRGVAVAPARPKHATASAARLLRGFLRRARSDLALARPATLRLTLLLSVVCSLALGSAVHAASFTGLGTLGGSYSMAFGVSADGSVVVGRSTTPYVNGDQAFVWTAAGGMVGLGSPPVTWPITGPNSDARGVSGDGRVVVGMAQGAQGNAEAYMWSSASGWQPLGSVVTGGDVQPAYSASYDGSVVVGMSSGSPFRWTASTGLRYLSGSLGSANAITPDGSVIVGRIGTSEAFRWTQAGGTVRLGDLPGGSFNSIANAVSRDGSVICGSSSSAPSSTEAFRWTESGGMVGLGDLPGGDFESSAYGVSGDGRTVVGMSYTDNGPEAFVWDELNGMEELANVLTDRYGLDLSGWSLDYARAISDDGSTIVGFGVNPSGRGEAWVVVIPEPTALALVGLGAAVLLIARRRRQAGLQFPRQKRGVERHGASPCS